MPFTAERVPNQPIVVITIGPTVDGASDPVESHAATHQLLADETGTVYRILDFSQVNVSFGDVVMGMNSDPGFRDPRMKTIMVGTHDLVQLAAQSAAQDQYGGRDIKLFTSAADAIAAAQADMVSG